MSQRIGLGGLISKLPGVRRLSAVQWVADVLLTLLLAQLVILVILSSWPPTASWAAAAFVLLGVLLRRAWPGFALCLACACAIAQMVAVQVPDMVNLGILMIVYACAAYGSRRIRIITPVVVMIGILVATAYLYMVLAPRLQEVQAQPEIQFGVAPPVIEVLMTLFLISLALGSAWLLGLVRFLVLRARSNQVERQLAVAASEHARERAAIEAERGRIAREMHDVLAHSLVTVATLSDGVKLTLRDDPESAEEAAGLISSVSREALTDVRRLLAQLRHEQPAGSPNTFDDAQGLLGRFQQAGLRVEWRSSGQPERLLAGVSLAAYRVVQEGLTNALRHGNGAATTVLADWSPGWLTVTVENAVPPLGLAATPDPLRASGGYGLAGLGERVRHEGGVIEHGIASERGERIFRLSARLPTVEPSAPVVAAGSRERNEEAGAA